VDYQPRTIAFLAELTHPPVPPDPRPAQKLHNQLFQLATPPYASFQTTPAGAILSNPVHKPQAVSQVAFLPDRIQFREELTAMTWESFGARLVEVIEQAAPLMGLQVLTTCQVVLRSLVNPRHFKDSREFLGTALLGVKEQLESFGRAPRTLGLRLSFPPEGEQSPPIELRVESYNADPRSLFLEVMAIRGPLALAQGLEPLGDHVRDAYRFLTDRALPFVGRFDARLPR
jgi:hypothetical protein